MTLASCTNEQPATKTTRESSSANRTGTADSCRPAMRSGKLPDWANAGFTHGTTDHFILSDRRQIVAVVFGYPLTERSTFKGGRQNKVRFIPREAAAESAGELRITAVLAVNGRTEKRTISPWPGASIIDLPEAGCWSLTLHWGHRTDSLDLRYRPE
ncbi:hypothetical protein G5C51_04530 [Streptomyces sp. A7024]|uniref:Uncharacterized protein n=1 Tax=Streptomyces coryli TaxID=1128680 RepID=A0A6G4TTH8_9ACTN|nr:hypothetical protein [Streptomyces coryli]NGN63174.1 hypothetical protein [Streptomyces coryli]